MAVLGIPLINGVAYTHADVVVNIGGVPIIGITAINYEENQSMTANYSTGHRATSVGFGPLEAIGSMTMTMEAMELISSVAPEGVIQNLPFFPIGINYLPEGGILARHRLENVKMMTRKQASQTGNSQIEVTVDLFIAKINWKAA